MFESIRDQRVAHIVDKEILDLAGMDDPGHVAVFEYWDRVRRARVGPPVGEFRLEALPPAIIPSIAVIDFLGPPMDFRYRFFGTHMVQVAGQELTGKRYFADNIEGFGFVNAEVLPMMIERREPVYSRTHWISVKDLKFTTASIRLPLSEDGETITGGVVVDRFTPGHEA